MDVLAAQEQVQLAEKILENARLLEQAVVERVRAGGTLALEQNRARSVAETTVIEVQLAQRQLAAARVRLVAQWAGQTPAFSEAHGELDAIALHLPALASLLEQVQASPELARWLAEVERRRSVIDIAKAERVPDIDLGLGWRHHSATGDDALVMAISAPLPLWDRKRGAIHEAEAQLHRAAATHLLVQADLQRDLAVLHARMLGAHEEAFGLRERVLPEAELAASRSADAYQAGAIRLTDVLDIQRTFYQLRLRYVHALTRYHIAAAQLEGLLGVPIAMSPTIDRAIGTSQIEGEQQ
jgi:cobalt-zinc-cadmium efflux system outer membrane protein